MNHKSGAVVRAICMVSAMIKRAVWFVNGSSETLGTYGVHMWDVSKVPSSLDSRLAEAESGPCSGAHLRSGNFAPELRMTVIWTGPTQHLEI